MTSTKNALDAPPEYLKPPIGEMLIEVIVLPVSDVDRARNFYAELGWRLDLDFAASDSYRVVQFTPPGSSCSIMFGKGLTNAEPGSVQGLHLIVANVEETRAKLLGRGIEISEMFFDSGGVFHHVNGECRVEGPHPKRQSYGTYASFKDPDGNGWFLQEVTARLPGHGGALPR